MLNLQLRLQNPKVLLQATQLLPIFAIKTRRQLKNVLGHLLQRWKVMVNPACSCKLVDLGDELDSEYHLKSPGFEAEVPDATSLVFVDGLNDLLEELCENTFKTRLTFRRRRKSLRALSSTSGVSIDDNKCKRMIPG